MQITREFHAGNLHLLGTITDHRVERVEIHGTGDIDRSWVLPLKDMDAEDAFWLGVFIQAIAGLAIKGSKCK